MLNHSNEKLGVLSTYLSKTDVLIRILERETEFFRDNQTAKATALFETKEQYINELENAKAILASDSQFLRSLPSEVKVKITEANEKLMKAAEINHKEVIAAREVNKLVLEAIYYGVAQNKGIAKGYGKSGSFDAEVNASPVAISQNV